MNTSSTLDKRDWIAGLEKGLGLIEAFDEQHSRMTATQAAARTGLTRTAARRYLLTLQHLGYVHSDGKLYWLAPKVLRLGTAYLESSRLARVVQPFLQRITAGTQESAFLSVLDGNDQVYIARNGGNRAMNIGFVTGARVPAALASAGLVILSTRPPEQAAAWITAYPLKTFTPHTIASKERLSLEVARARHHGYCVLEQQLELSVRGVAVPLRDHLGECVAALSVSMPIAAETTDAAVGRVLPTLLETAQGLRNLI
jgi:IclR family transcriptional regulator, pca regulon regulatory protein